VTDLKKFILRLKRLPAKVRKDLNIALKEREKEFAEMQRQRLEDGEDRAGEDLEYLGVRRAEPNEFGTYANFYSKEKSSTGGTIDKVDLKLTGRFHNSIKSNVTGNRIRLKATDTDEAKIKFINTFYKPILGFSPEQKAELVRKLRPVIFQSVKQAIKE